MKNKIIVLKGRPGAGKTCTLIKVCAKLRRLNKYPVEIIDECKLLPDKNDDKIKDIYFIVRVNGINIGIVTHGDIKAVIEAYIEKFTKRGCKIIICAARTHGETIKALKAIKSQTDYEMDVIKKKRGNSKLDSEHAKASDAKAEEIVAMVEKYVSLCHKAQ